MGLSWVVVQRLRAAVVVAESKFAKRVGGKSSGDNRGAILSYQSPHQPAALLSHVGGANYIITIFNIAS